MKIRNSCGSILLMVLIFSLIFAILGIISMKLIIAQNQSDELETTKLRLFYAADSTVERSMSEFIRIINNYKDGDSFWELPLATQQSNVGSPWRTIERLDDFQYTEGGGVVGPVFTRYSYYIEEHINNPNRGAIRNHWMVYDSTTTPPIRTQAILREETYPAGPGGLLLPAGVPEGAVDSWRWNINDGLTPINNRASITHTIGATTWTRRYYVITARASLYNPDTNELYGDQYISEAHILVERNNGNPAANNRFNYVFRSRKNL